MKNKILALGMLALLIAPVAAHAQQAKTDVRVAPEMPVALDHLAALIEKAIPAGKPVKVAIAPFTNLGPTAHEKKLGDIASELLVTRLTGKENITIIERAQLNQVLDELKLSMLGLTEGSNAEQVGKLLGAEAMIVGSVSEVGDQFAITARHVDVGSGKVIFAREVRVPQANTIALSSQYIVTKSRGDAFFRSLLIPGWGQQYNDQTVKGWTFTGLTLGIAGFAVAQHVVSDNKYDAYLNAASTEESNELYDSAQSAATQRNVALITLGAFWAFNAIDAVINGTSASQVRVDRQAEQQPQPEPQAELDVLSDGTVTAGVRVDF